MPEEIASASNFLISESGIRSTLIGESALTPLPTEDFPL
jgi:hypothetical protein